MGTENSGAINFEVTITTSGGSRSFKQNEESPVEMIVVEEHVDMVSMATMRMSGGEEQEPWDFEIGNAVVVKIEDKTLFNGELVSLEPVYQVDGTTSITLRAMDKTHKLGRGRKTRFWEETKDSDVASEVGAECGLSVDADDTSTTMPYILQRNESNSAFLKRLAARNNFQLRVETDLDGGSNTLVFKKASFQGEVKELAVGEDIRSLKMSYNSADQVSKVVVRGWDIANKEEVVGEAEAGGVTTIGGGEIGAEVCKDQFGESTAYITDVPISSQGMATAIAEAEMERYARQFCRGTCVLGLGDSTIQAGSMVQFDGLAQGQNGKYYVVSARHIVSARSGYTTEIHFCSNTLGT